MPLEVSRHAVGSRTLIRVRLLDRRLAHPVEDEFLFQHDVEQCLYGGNNGALHQLYARCSLQAAPLPLKKSSVPTLVTAQEYAELVRLFSEGLPLESQGRVRNVTLIGVNHIAALCAKKGRDEKSIALLRGLSVELPRLWQLQLQAEEHAANQEVDLLLGDAIAEEEELETSLFAELHHMASFQEDTEDEQKVQNLALSPVPASVQAELKAYTDYRLEPLNRMRDGSCVVECTASNDVQIFKRLLGWLKNAHGVVPGLASVCGSVQLGPWVEEYVKVLREERELKYSTIANYINGIFNVTNYCFAALEPAADALRLEPSSLEQLLNMRAQSEKLAKEDRLFQRKDPNWVDWPTVQAGRIKCLQEWRASAGKPFAQRQKLLRELLIMLFHSVQPPDRVGIVRRLRYGQSIKPNGDGYDLDLSKMRFKNSKFYGPTVTSVSQVIVPYLTEYLRMLDIDTLPGEAPYIFGPVSDSSRAMTSSAWSAHAKAIIKRWTAMLKTSRRSVRPDSPPSGIRSDIFRPQ